jgi:hypothetical protein
MGVIMNKLTRDVSLFKVPVGVAVVFPVLIIGSMVTLGDGLPLQATAVMIGAFAMGLVWAGMSIASRVPETRLETTREAAMVADIVEAMETVPELGLTYELSAPTVPRSMSVTEAIGTCPRGLLLGDRIQVDADGRLSVPVCKTAAAALGSVLVQADGGSDFDGQVGCQCPVTGPGLTFSVETPGHQDSDREAAPSS